MVLCETVTSSRWMPVLFTVPTPPTMIPPKLFLMMLPLTVTSDDAITSTDCCWLLEMVFRVAVTPWLISNRMP